MNRSAVMAKRFCGSGKGGGSRKARDQKFHSASHHSSVLSTQCWVSPSADMEEAGFRVSLLSQNSGKERPYQMSSADYRQEEMQL